MGACSTNFCGCKMYYVDHTVMEMSNFHDLHYKSPSEKGKSSPNLVQFGLLDSENYELQNPS